MRGRTNITQRAVPYVNGDVLEAEVETGTVNVGDFLEYKTVSAVEEVSVVTQYSKINEYTTENYKFLLSGNSSTVRLECWSITQKDIVAYINIACSSRKDTSMDVIDENNILLSVQGSTNNNTATIYYISFDGSELLITDLEDIATPTTSGVANLVRAIMHLSDTTFLVLRSPNADSMSYFDIGTYDSTNKTLSVSTSNSITFLRAQMSEVAIKYIDENLIAIFSNYYSSVSRGVKCHLVEIINNTSYTLKQDLKYPDSNNAYILGNTAIIYDDYIMFKIAQSTTSGPAYPYLFRYNRNNDVIEALGSTSVSETSARAGFTLLYKNVFAFTYDNTSTHNAYFVILKFNESSGQFSVITSQINVGGMVAYLSFYDNNIINMFALRSTSPPKGYKITIIYKNDELIQFVDKNYVKQYDGGNTIGFAKTPGIAGENVMFYVPHQEL